MASLLRGGLGALPVNQASSQLVRTSTGNLYAVLAVSNRVQVYKSTNNGAQWDEVDYRNAPSGNTTTPATAAAIDGNDTIHIVYKTPGALTNRYIQFLTSTDTFGRPETINVVTGAVATTIAIAVDSNNVPHVAASDSGGPQALYFNRVGKSGGLWNRVILGNTSGSFADIQIDNNNVPQISLDSAGSGLVPYIGNQNNATAFTTGPNLTGSAALGSSLAIDSLGNTWVANNARGGNLVRLWKHNKTDAFSVWQSAIDDGFTGTNVSLATIGTDIYILYERSAGGIAYDRYDSINNKWLGEQILQANTTAIQWHNPFVKWSNYFDNGLSGANNTSSNTIEYLFDNGSTVFYDRLITAQISVGLAAISFRSNAAATTTSTSSTSSSTSTSTSASTSSTSSSTSVSTSSTSSSTSLSTSSTSSSTSTSVSTSSTSASTSLSTSSTSSSTSRSTSTSSTSSSISTSTSLSTSSTSSSTSISTSSTSASTSLSTSSTSSSTSTSSTSSSTSTSSTSTSATGTTTSTSSTSASTSTSISISTSSTSASTSTSISISTSSTSTSLSTSTSVSTTSHSTSTSLSTSSTSTSVSTSHSTSTTSSSLSTSTSLSTSSTSQSTSLSTSISTSSTSTSLTTTTSTSSTSTSLSTTTSVSATTSTSSTSSSTSTTTTLIDYSTTPRPTLPQPVLHFGIITAQPSPRSPGSDVPRGVISIDHIRPNVRVIYPTPRIRHNR